MASLRSSAIPVSDPAAGLRITEIFYSLQGEANTFGLPTVFIRLTGCPLRCSYCDTTYSFEGGERFSLEHIIETASQYKTPYICVTGGEPLAQPNCLIHRSTAVYVTVAGTERGDGLLKSIVPNHVLKQVRQRHLFQQQRLERTTLYSLFPVIEIVQVAV